MRTVDIHEAETDLARLVEGAAKGEAFVIAKAGRPLVKVVPVESAEEKPPRRLGFMAGAFDVPEDFDRMFETEILEMFGIDP